MPYKEKLIIIQLVVVYKGFIREIYSRFLAQIQHDQPTLLMLVTGYLPNALISRILFYIDSNVIFKG